LGERLWLPGRSKPDLWPIAPNGRNNKGNKGLLASEWV